MRRYFHDLHRTRPMRTCLDNHTIIGKLNRYLSIEYCLRSRSDARRTCEEFTNHPTRLCTHLSFIRSCDKPPIHSEAEREANRKKSELRTNASNHHSQKRNGRAADKPGPETDDITVTSTCSLHTNPASGPFQRPHEIKVWVCGFLSTSVSFDAINTPVKLDTIQQIYAHHIYTRSLWGECVECKSSSYNEYTPSNHIRNME